MNNFLYNSNSKSFSSHKGFVILFTILISAIIMMIGLGIYSIAVRETILSGSAREAQYAFYAADAGVECALFAQTISPTPYSQGGPSFSCGAAAVPIQVIGTGIVTGMVNDPFQFNVLVDTNKKTCAHVSVFDTVAGTTPVRRIISQGYNICDTRGVPLVSSSLLVERDLDTQFEITTTP